MEQARLPKTLHELVGKMPCRTSESESPYMMSCCNKGFLQQLYIPAKQRQRQAPQRAFHGHLRWRHVHRPPNHRQFALRTLPAAKSRECPERGSKLSLAGCHLQFRCAMKSGKVRNASARGNPFPKQNDVIHVTSAMDVGMQRLELLH